MIHHVPLHTIFWRDVAVTFVIVAISIIACWAMHMWPMDHAEEGNGLAPQDDREDNHKGEF